MRTPVIAGNWKLHMNPEQATEFVNAVKGKLPDPSKVESVIAASAVDLYVLKKAVESSSLHTSAENAYFEVEGAFTGETSPKALNEMGTDYCIVGHPERRDYFHETSEGINKKVKALFANGVAPIICCGKSLETREVDKQEEWVITQTRAALDDLTAKRVSELVIAYEPIWAIDTGRTASASQAEEMCRTIRETVKDLYNEETAKSVHIQYGGSAKPANVGELTSKPDINGDSVGGTSLGPESFLALVSYQD